MTALVCVDEIDSAKSLLRVCLCAVLVHLLGRPEQERQHQCDECERGARTTKSTRNGKEMARRFDKFIYRCMRMFARIRTCSWKTLFRCVEMMRMRVSLFSFAPQTQIPTTTLTHVTIHTDNYRTLRILEEISNASAIRVNRKI